MQACIAPGAVRRVLLVEPDADRRDQALNALRTDNVEITVAAGADDALRVCREAGERSQVIDLIVTGIDLPDRKGFDLVDKLIDLPSQEHKPLVVWTGRELTKKEETHLSALRSRRYFAMFDHWNGWSMMFHCSCTDPSRR